MSNQNDAEKEENIRTINGTLKADWLPGCVYLNNIKFIIGKYPDGQIPNETIPEMEKLLCHAFKMGKSCK